MRSFSRAFLGSATALAALLSLAGVSAANVLVVDAAGGGQYTAIQAAVDAAVDGDTVLVKPAPGNYPPFAIDRKALTVVADTGAGQVRIFGTIAVVNLEADQTVVLAGLMSTGWDSLNDPPETARVGLYAVGNAGPLRAQLCYFLGGQGFTDAYCTCLQNDPCSGAAGVVVRGNSAGVAFDRCTIRGGTSFGEYQCGCGTPANNRGGTGIDLRDGMLALYDCNIGGGNGGQSCEQAGDGEPGVRIGTTGAFTLLGASGTIIRGGWGGNGIAPNPTGADGDHGIELGAGTFAWLLENDVLGGPGGEGCAFPECVGQDGQDGQPIAGEGTTYTFAVPKLRLEVPTPLREGTATTLTVRGRPGDEVYLWISRETTFHSTASWKGVRLVKTSGGGGGLLKQAHPVRILGTIPASGVLVTDLQAPVLEPGVLADDLFLQVWRDSPVDGRAVGRFAAVTVLDSAF